MSSRLNPSVQYIVGAGDVSKTRFDFLFSVLRSDDVKVVLGNGQQLTTYTVTLNVDKNGGYIDFPNAFSVGTRLTIYREMIFSRQTQFRENEDFHASVINEEFDRMVMLLQQAGKATTDSLRQANYDIPMDMMLPPVEQRADKLLGFDNSGRPKVLFDPSESAKDAKASADEAKKSADVTIYNRKLTENKIKAIDMALLAKKDASNIDSNAYKNALGLGTASARNIGNSAGDIPILDNNHKLPKSTYEAGDIGRKLHINTSGKFFVRNANGSLPSGVNSNKVWSLNNQQKGYNMMPTGKIHIEIPAGTSNFILAGAGGGGASFYGNGNSGGRTTLSGKYALGGAGGRKIGNANKGSVQSMAGANGSGVIVHAGGAIGGVHAFGNAENGQSGLNGGMLKFTLNLRAGTVLDFSVGAGGQGATSSANAGSSYDIYRTYRTCGQDGANGYIEVEYV